jgi:hypothetical protein
MAYIRWSLQLSQPFPGVINLKNSRACVLSEDKGFLEILYDF